MANKKITELPAATVVNPTDKLVIVQGGVTKSAAASLVGSSLATTNGAAVQEASEIATLATGATQTIGTTFELAANRTYIVDVELLIETDGPNKSRILTERRVFRTPGGAVSAAAQKAIGDSPDDDPAGAGPASSVAITYTGTTGRIDVTNSSGENVRVSCIRQVRYLETNAAAAVFDPATLALASWNRGSYAGAPWAGVASAGTSGAHSLLATGGSPPTAGTPVNGYAPAAFDGVAKYMDADGTANDYMTAAAYSGWALVKVNAITTNDATAYNNEAISIFAGSAYFGVVLKSTGVVKVFAYDTGLGDFNGPEAAITTGAWALVQWKYDGTNLKIRVNNGAWTSLARSNLPGAFSTEVVYVGYNPNVAKYFNGEILDRAWSKVALSDADFDNVRSYCNARYGLAV